MTQTAECLPPRLLHRDYVGDKYLCDCHIYVLSYKKKCNKVDTARFNSTSPNITYLYKPGIGWGGGRNAIFNTARNSGHKYLYYLFMDDDVRLEYNTFTPKELKTTPPFRIFTDFLLRYRPAGAGPDYQHSNVVGNIIHTWHFKCNKYFIPEAFSVKFLDHCFTAFHKDTVDIVLPYTLQFDSLSYSIPCLQNSFAFQLAYFGHLMYFPWIRATNAEHRHHKDGYVHDMPTRTRMVNEMKNRTPTKYKNHSFFEFALRYREDTHMHLWCNDPPPQNTPIIPYQNMHDFTPKDFTAP